MTITKPFLSCLVLVAAVPLVSSWLQAASVADISLYKGKDRQSKIEAGARKEGEVEWYTSLSTEDSSQVAQLFEKRYPFVKIKLTRLTSERARSVTSLSFRPTASSRTLSIPMTSRWSYRGARGLYRLFTLRRWRNMTNAFCSPRAFGWRAG